MFVKIERLKERSRQSEFERKVLKIKRNKKILYKNKKIILKKQRKYDSL